MTDAPATLAGDPPAAPARRRRKKRRLPAWTHPALYGAIRLASSGVHLAGIEPSMRAMRAAGGAFARAPFNRARFERAVANLSWCFPDWPEDKARAYATESYRHLFSLAVEVNAAPRLLTADGYAAYVRWGDMREGLEILCSGRPCLLITGHCGNWELLGYTLALLGFPVHALYRPLDMKPLDRWAQRTRSRRGLTLVDKFGASTVLPEIVARAEPAGFIADQNAGDRGLFVPFFDRLASTYKTIGLLAMRYEAPVICGQAIRLSGLTAENDAPAAEAERLEHGSSHFRYSVDVVDVIRPEDWADRPDPLYYITARYRRAIETMVRRAPEQYLWMHRYWKSRPRHERLGRPFPPALRAKIEALPWMTEERVGRIVERSASDAAEIARS